MSFNITWRIYCITEGDWTSGTLLDTAGTPTTCFNDAEHQVNPNSVQIVEQVSIKETTSVDEGALESKGGLAVKKSAYIGGNLVLYGKDSGDPTEIPQICAKAISVTDTTTAASGTLATYHFNECQQSTLNASNSDVTTTDAATLYIAGPPIAGSNQTFTNKYSLWIGGGDVRIDSSIVNFSGTLQYDIVRAYVRDEKSIGSHGGTFSSGAWRERDVNTITADTGSGVSLPGGNVIRMDPGTYIIDASAPAYAVKYNTTRFWNVTDSTVELLGTCEYASPSDNTVRSVIHEKLVVSGATKDFCIQHRCSYSKSNTGWGLGSGYQIEVFTRLFITRLL